MSLSEGRSLSPCAGIKRKQHGPGPRPSFGREDELDHSKAKRHQSHALVQLAHEQCLGTKWTPCIMDMDHSNKNPLDAIFTDNSYSHTRDLPLAFHDAYSTNHHSRLSDHSLNVNISMEHENVQAATQLTQNSFNPYHNMCTQVTSETHVLNQLHPKANIPVSSTAKSQTAQICPECAAGKSGHIRHIGRWRLMDSE